MPSAVAALQHGYGRIAEALCNLGLALQGLGRFDEAASHLRHALRLRSDFAAAHNALGVLLRDQGRLDEALGNLRQAVEGDPQLAAAHSNLGQLLLDLGRAEEALPPCLQCALQPDLAAARDNLGNVLRELGRFVEARAAYAEPRRSSGPDLVPALANLGLTLQREASSPTPCTWLEQAVRAGAGQPRLVGGPRRPARGPRRARRGRRVLRAAFPGC